LNQFPEIRERESNIIFTNLSGKFGKIEHYNRVKRKLIEFLLKFHENLPRIIVVHLLRNFM